MASLRKEIRFHKGDESVIKASQMLSCRIRPLTIEERRNQG